ncbi:transcriptional regulator, tetr family [hydrocarbon metagenome]|uniref:Transcriptional regulator, tetr family n=1 Tax=hydrocarbon metagenome TaxID=938273 RepID=A0A0W8FXA3_9ZZZZ
MKELSESLKILEFCETHFMHYGFHKTTMEEIAKELRISKKTIYKHFSSKDDLVRAVFIRIRNDLASQIEATINGSGDTMIKLYKISRLFSNRIAAISDNWLNDLRLYAPDVWREVEEFRTNMMQKNMLILVGQGKAEGLIIDYPNTIIMGVLISAIQGVVNPNFVLHNNISLHEAGELTLEIVFSGISTKKGRKLFKQYKSGN